MHKWQSLTKAPLRLHVTIACMLSSHRLSSRITKLVATFGLLLFVATLWFSDLSGYTTSVQKASGSFAANSLAESLPGREDTAFSDGSAHTATMAHSDELASFLEKNKADFVNALNDGSSLEGWVMVMGALQCHLPRCRASKCWYCLILPKTTGNEAGGRVSTLLQSYSDQYLANTLCTLCYRSGFYSFSHRICLFRFSYILLFFKFRHINLISLRTTLSNRKDRSSFTSREHWSVQEIQHRTLFANTFSRWFGRARK